MVAVVGNSPAVLPRLAYGEVDPPTSGVPSKFMLKAKTTISKLSMVASYLRMSYGCAHAYGYGHTTKLVQLVTTLLLALFQIINALKGDLQFTQPGEESGII